MVADQLVQLEEEAFKAGLLLRVQVRRPLNLWTIKLVVAEQVNAKKIRILGEMKGWAYGAINGLQLDTMLVHPKAPSGIGHLVWASTMAWSLEETPCEKARLLAIRDDEGQHQRLVRYFSKRGFRKVGEVGSSPFDFPLRMVWGGAGTLMVAECREVLRSSCRLWKNSQAFKRTDQCSSA